MQLTHRYWRIVPPALTGLVVSTLVAVLLFDGKVPTIGSAYGAIPSALPALQFPELSLERVLHLIQPALVIALLGSVESLLSAVVADGMTGERHRSNRELIGQGVANIVTPLFGGIPATGAIARTAANIRNGAVSPVSGMVHSIFILLVVLTFAPLASAIPLASMAPILMNVAWNMSERRHFAHILRTKTSDSLILIVTFALTVLLDITIAVQAGLVLAVLVFVVRMARSMTIAKVLPDPARGNGKMAAHQVRKDRDCPQIHIYTVEGPLFFGTADALEGLYDELNRSNPRTVILRMAKVPFIDLTGESNLSAVVKAVQQYGGQVILTGIQPQPLGMLQKTGLAARIGPDLIFERTGPAVDEALRRLDVQRCLGCRHYAFRECVRLSESVSESACESAAASAVDLPKAAVPSS
jgi:SulP family sulfate permease